MTPLYFEKFVVDTKPIFDGLMALDWLNVTEARKELFFALEPREYSYGQGVNRRLYLSTPYFSPVLDIQQKINSEFGTTYDVCFLNRYDTQKHQLGWHSDDGVDGSHPIAVISFGAEREIWWKEKNYSGVVPMENRRLLKDGSIFIMLPGMQATHLHKIPRSDRACGTRISLTFRRYENV